MTVAPTIARCPRCGDTPSIFIRSGDWEPGVDNLVCSKSCREDPASRVPIENPSSSSRRVFGRRR